MKLQCSWCQKLALNHPGSAQSTDWTKRVAFSALIRGKHEGCAGCRLICELLPLLNDYYTGPDDASKLSVRRVDHYFAVEIRITSKEGTRQRMWIGDFELCKTNGRCHFNWIFVKQAQFANDYHLLDGPAPWSCVQDEIEVPAYRHLEPGSDKSYDLIASWYATCRQNHDVCSMRRATEGPTRLLNIGSGPTCSSTTIRLEECDPSTPPEFIALSHCWGCGDDQPLVTLQENVKIHKTGIEITSLPRTFRDAVAVSRRLGEQYLWINSLCIIQDDDQDKACEIPRMLAIYEGAALTISAMSARDGRGGCWIPRKSIFELPLDDYGKSARLAFHRSEELAFQHVSFLSSHLDKDLDTQYPLATRKWALQERVLSRRILHFTAQDLVWECRHSARCACGTLDILYPDHLQQNTFEVLTNQNADCPDQIFCWMNIVKSYSHADLTNETDLFPALAGLASAFFCKTLGPYCAGLWEVSLPVALCWYTRQVEADEATHCRPSVYVAPTWSWGSIQGALCFDALDNIDTYLDENGFRPVARCISVVCEPMDHRNPFGQIKSGRLKIRAMVAVTPPGSVATRTIAGFEGASSESTRWAIFHGGRSVSLH